MKRIIKNISDIRVGENYTFEKPDGDRYVNRGVVTGVGHNLIHVNGQGITVKDLMERGFIVTQEVPAFSLPIPIGSVIQERHSNGAAGIHRRIDVNEWVCSDGSRLTNSELCEHIIEQGATVEVLEPRNRIIAEVIGTLRRLNRDKASNKAWADALAEALGVDA